MAKQLIKEVDYFYENNVKWAFSLFPTRNCLWKQDCSHYAQRITDKTRLIMVETTN